MKLTKEAVYGFAASVAAGIITLYVFYNYMQKETVNNAIEEYYRRKSLPSTEYLIQLSKVYNK